MNQYYSFGNHITITNSDPDFFVGIKIENNKIIISFPHGFNVSKEKKTLREDLKLLLRILDKFGKGIEGEHYNFNFEKEILEHSFPIGSYIYVIEDFLQRGYFSEKEVNFSENGNGRINWNRTIKKMKPYFDDNNAFYLNFIKRQSVERKYSLIREIHKYIVFNCFYKIGWLYSDYLPEKSNLSEPNINYLISEIKSKLYSTFDERDRILFFHFLVILDNLKISINSKQISYGTKHFEHIWEKMIDTIYSNQEINDYYPKTTWHIKGNNTYHNKNLQPDTIMKLNNFIYVLDAKYYRFGVSRKLYHLPDTSSIHKQITYSENIWSNKSVSIDSIYNIFLLPFNKENNFYLEYIGYSKSSWKLNNISFEKVHAILIDTKTVMKASLVKQSHYRKELQNLLKENLDC